MSIHPCAHVDPKADLDPTVIVGPFCHIEPGVRIEANTKLESHVTIKSGTMIGKDNYFAEGSIIGGDPQDRGYKNEPTFLVIGDRNKIREYVTIHRATGEGKTTTIGDDNFIMANCHVAHNVVIENGVVITNGVGLAGFVTVEEHAVIGGMTGVHQFVRIGKLSMVAGMSRIVKDVPPFMVVEGMDARVYDINAIGLRRADISAEARQSLHKACKLLFKSQLGVSHATEIILREVKMTAEVQYLLDFMDRVRHGKNGRGDQR